MNRQDLDDLEKRIMEEVVKRRKLGGYNSEAESVLLLSESLLDIVRHLKRTRSPPKAMKLRVIDYTSGEARGFAPKVAEWLNDRKHMRYSEQRFRTHSAISVLNDWRDKSTTFLAIINEHGVLVGTISAFADYHNKIIDLGILIAPGFSKWGLASEAWALAMKLFSGAYVKKIEAGCMANNKAMIKVFKRCGMKYEGRRIKHFQYSKTKRVDVVYYGRFK